MAWTLLAPHLVSCPETNPKIEWQNFPGLTVVVRCAIIHALGHVYSGAYFRITRVPSRSSTPPASAKLRPQPSHTIARSPFRSPVARSASSGSVRHHSLHGLDSVLMITSHQCLARRCLITPARMSIGPPRTRPPPRFLIIPNVSGVPLKEFSPQYAAWISQLNVTYTEL